MESSSLSSSGATRPVRTVLGEAPYQALGITDAHNHVWIEPVAGADPAAPVLDHYDRIKDELDLYRTAGGQSLLDCQPAGCGRNGNTLACLSKASSVNIIACTGFHRQKYYPPDYWLFRAGYHQIADHFLEELTSALIETRDEIQPIRAGFIKIALESTWNNTPQPALEGAIEAARQTGSLVEIHTEQGRLAEKAVIFFENHGVAPAQLVLCHMDKRPDHGLHAELARYGVLLEYDTFYRPKYEPEAGLWPLINRMVTTGFGDHVTLATDMAESVMYMTIGNGPGLASLPTEIKSRLEKLGIPADTIQQMLGANIARRLAGLE